MKSELPTDEQRKALCELFSWAFIEMRAIGAANQGRQVSELAEIFHEIPREMWGWGGWDLEFFRQRLEQYQNRYHQEWYEGLFNYVAHLNKIWAPE